MLVSCFIPHFQPTFTEYLLCLQPCSPAGDTAVSQAKIPVLSGLMFQWGRQNESIRAQSKATMNVERVVRIWRL